MPTTEKKITTMWQCAHPRAQRRFICENEMEWKTRPSHMNVNSFRQWNQSS